MIITGVQVDYVTDFPFPQAMRPTWRSGGIWATTSWVVTRLHTDEGLTGIGAGYRPPSDLVREYLIGKDPFATEQHIQVIRSAGGDWVVDLALWDLIGKACGQPLYKLWGGYKDRVKAYVSLVELGTPESRAEDALRFLEEGFQAIKLRLRADTIRDDVALVQAVRNAVGDRMEIMVDANQAGASVWPRGQPVWTYERALKTAQELEALGVVWLEEPLPRYDFERLARLCDAVGMHIAGGEGNKGLHEFRWLIERDVYDVIQPESLGSEALSQLRKVAALAEMHGKWFVLHNGNSGVGLAAHLQLSAAVPNCPYVEYLYDPPGLTVEAWQALLSEPLTIDREGYLPVPQKPGLGIELNDDLIAAYAVD